MASALDEQQAARQRLECELIDRSMLAAAAAISPHAARQVFEAAANGGEEGRRLVVLRLTPEDVSAAQHLVELAGDKLSRCVVFRHALVPEPKEDFSLPGEVIQRRPQQNVAVCGVELRMRSRRDRHGHEALDAPPVEPWPRQRLLGAFECSSCQCAQVGRLRRRHFGERSIRLKGLIDLLVAL